MLDFQNDDNVPRLSKLLCSKIKIFDFFKRDYIKCKQEMLNHEGPNREDINQDELKVSNDEVIDPTKMELL